MSAFDAEQTVQILANNEKQTIEKRIERTKEVVDSLKSSQNQDILEAFASDARLVEAVLANCGEAKNSKELADFSMDLLIQASKKVNEHAVLNYVSSMIKAMDSTQNRAGTIAGALDFLSSLSETAPTGVSVNLVRLMPVVAGLVNDASQLVADAARKCVEKLCHTIDNRDIEPFIDDMVAATIDHDRTDDCVQKLASTTFVQTITAAPLALISPILLLGFRARTTATKRMCAVILNNMSKLVEDPEDAEPFLDKLLTSVEKASNEISDPEARALQ